MAQTINPNLYQPDLPLELLVNKLSTGSNFVTSFMHRKEKQLSTLKTHGYYDIFIINNKPLNFENFDNF